MNESELADRAKELLERYLAESGIRVRRIARGRSGRLPRPDTELRVQLPGGGHKRLVVEFKANARRAPLESALTKLRLFAGDAVPLIFAPHLGRPIRQWLREQGVWFADLSGNRFFKAPDLLVDKEVAERAPDLRPSAIGVFADRNSLVLRYLIERPSIRVGVRELASLLGISPAAVSNSLRALEEMGRLERSSGELRLLDREDLLEDWGAFYRPRFRKQEQARFYVHARDPEALISMLRSHRQVAQSPGYGLSLHAGASLVEPYVQFREVHAYVAEGSRKVRADMLRALGAQPAEKEANLILLSPFYKHSVLFGSRALRGVRVVSNLQLYLDLMCHPRRGPEQAEVILQRRLRPAWSRE